MHPLPTAAAKPAPVLEVKVISTGVPVALPSRIWLGMTYDPGPGFRRRWHSKSPINLSIECEAGLRQFVVDHDMSFQTRYERYLPATVLFDPMKDIPLSFDVPLPEGTWTCTARLSESFMRDDGAEVRRDLTSPPFELVSRSIALADEQVLDEASLLSDYKGIVRHRINASQELRLGQNSIVEKHPESVYYCHQYADSIKRQFTTWVDYPRPWKDQLDTALCCRDERGIEWMMLTLRHLENQKCELIRPEEYALIRTFLNLGRGNLRAAKIQARVGIATTEREGYRDFFHRVLDLTEEDYARERQRLGR